MIINKIMSRGIQKGIEGAVKRLSMNATQKTVAQIGSRVAISTATTVGATVINSKIQQKEAAKLADKLNAVAEGSEEPMTEEEIAMFAKKGQRKANVSSGLVIGAGTAASTLVDIAFKAI